MAHFSVYEMLNRKRRGERLADSDIATFIAMFVAREIPDYQMTAFLMAVAIHGMDQGELAALTRAMIESGEQWQLRRRHDFVADKHSTGGVGDKVSLALAPWVAACGVKVGMLSGRGLGHTGGTLDKLESIPGFNARLSREEFERCLDEVGCVIATSTAEIAPADRRMYALRDVTGTVESLPLITASIMSKKLAMGASALILDVKTGSGAFMRDYERSRELAQSLIAAAEASGTKVEAVITEMDRPLGIAAGNANEVVEAIDVLRRRAPLDVTAITRVQAVRILILSGRFDASSANRKLEEVLESGAALDHARRWIAAQGGDPSFIDDPSRLPSPRRVVEVRSPRSGFITSIDTRAAGLFVGELGAGRRTESDDIDPAVGVLFEKKTGDAVTSGEVIAHIQLGAVERDDDDLRTRYLSLLTIGDRPPAERPLVHEIIKARK